MSHEIPSKRRRVFKEGQSVVWPKTKYKTTGIVGEIPSKESESQRLTPRGESNHLTKKYHRRSDKEPPPFSLDENALLPHHVELAWRFEKIKTLRPPAKNCSATWDLVQEASSPMLREEIITSRKKDYFLKVPFKCIISNSHRLSIFRAYCEYVASLIKEGWTYLDYVKWRANAILAMNRAEIQPTFEHQRKSGRAQDNIENGATKEKAADGEHQQPGKDANGAAKALAATAPIVVKSRKRGQVNESTDTKTVRMNGNTDTKTATKNTVGDAIEYYKFDSAFQARPTPTQKPSKSPTSKEERVQQRDAMKYNPKPSRSQKLRPMQQGYPEHVRQIDELKFPAFIACDDILIRKELQRKTRRLHAMLDRLEIHTQFFNQQERIIFESEKTTNETTIAIHTALSKLHDEFSLFRNMEEDALHEAIGSYRQAVTSQGQVRKVLDRISRNYDADQEERFQNFVSRVDTAFIVLY